VPKLNTGMLWGSIRIFAGSRFSSFIRFNTWMGCENEMGLVILCRTTALSLWLAICSVSSKIKVYSLRFLFDDCDQLEADMIVRVLLTLGILLCALGGAMANDVPYRLGVQDKLRIHVQEWPALTGEFTVGAGGAVSLPVIGPVPATGLQPEELAAAIATRLQQKVDLASAPETTVEVSQYRPFYILGGVERPGEYAYRPGMMVVNALTIAGGAYRLPRTSAWNFERDAIASRGDLRLAAVRKEELAAKEIRLKAEAEGLEKFPPAPANASPEVLHFMELEKHLFETRLERLVNQSATLKDSVVLLEREIESLHAQIAVAQKQKDSVSKELDDTRRLVERAILPAPRVLPLERTVAQIEREQKELETAILRARQQINSAKIQIGNLADERRSTAASELQKLEVTKKEVDERVETASRLVSGSSIMGSSPDDSSDVEGARPLLFSIIREEGGVVKEQSVTETTRVEPGDIIKVFRPRETLGIRMRVSHPEPSIVPGSGAASPGSTGAAGLRTKSAAR
jgi:hypothetical protein